MSAAALMGSAKSNGLRPINLRTDLGAVADLIELCFADQMDAQGRAAMHEMRFLSRAGPLLWLLALLNQAVRGISHGFVWIEAGRLVGNVTLYRADLPEWGWIIANVAVHPDYRRCGIARELMLASLDAIRLSGVRPATLQVEHSNVAAINLYRALGFYTVRTWVTWRRPAHFSAPPAEADVPIEAAAGDDWRALYDLACVTRPSGLGWMRAVAPGAFRPGPFEALRNLFSGAVVERYLVRDGAGGAAAALTVSMGFGAQRDVLTFMVHPRRRGELERPLLAFALRRLAGRGRSVAVEHPHDDAAGAAALEAFQFRPHQTLTIMRHDLD